MLNKKSGCKEGKRMKRVLYSTAGLFLSIACVSAAHGGAIDNKTNWSAEYIRSLNRNAATDFADIAAYNPAGTVKLQDGLILNGSVHYINKQWTNVISGTDYESEEPSFVPGLFAVYNKGPLSFFGSLTVVAGGGKLDFGDGDWTTMQIFGYLSPSYTPLSLPVMEIEGESFYLGYTVGSAFEVNDMLSLAIGLRFVDAHKEASGSISYTGLPEAVDLSYEQDGSGWGGIFGLNFAPNDKLNIGLRFETETAIKLDTSTDDNTTDTATFALLPYPVSFVMGKIDDTLEPRNLPAILAGGISYWLTPKLRVETDCTYYFNENADWGGAEDDVKNGYDLGIAFEYHFNDSLLASIGYLYTVLGVDPEDMLAENPELDAHTVGAGIAYAINENLLTNISIGNAFYVDDSYTPGPEVEFKKNNFFLAMGLEYRF